MKILYWPTILKLQNVATLPRFMDVLTKSIKDNVCFPKMTWSVPLFEMFLWKIKILSVSISFKICLNFTYLLYYKSLRYHRNLITYGTSYIANTSVTTKICNLNFILCCLKEKKTLIAESCLQLKRKDRQISGWTIYENLFNGI